MLVSGILLIRKAILISPPTNNRYVDIPLIARAREQGDRTAIISTEGVFTYQQLLDTSEQFAKSILEDVDDLKEQRVAFLIPSGFQYTATQWGIWRAGGVAVPLCVSHPVPELEYAIADSGATIAIAHPIFETILRPIAEARGLRFILTTEMFNCLEGALPELNVPHASSTPLATTGGTPATQWLLKSGNPPTRLAPEEAPAARSCELNIDEVNAAPGGSLRENVDRRAMILYTSGTTSKPKGVVTTHKNIQAQVTSLISAWEWTAEDQILHVLPLHHIHGIINVLTCALWAGAKCEILEKFNAQAVWTRIITGKLTLFMAVPTIYAKLITAWETAPCEQQKAMSDACAQLRLMVSGSAALPVQVLEKWKTISGHVLLERYGMTEIGMALSNPLHGQRLPGHVGTPLPNIEVRLVDELGLVEPETPGEIQVKGPGVFLEYWRKPEATTKAFDDGWFRTGDIAVVEDGSYRILGRSSVDIIKTGGYKVSALEIEEVLRSHLDIQDCAVVGVADSEWGERVCAALVPIEGKSLTLASLRSWAKERLAVYKIPTEIILLNDLPRNAMGKVIKPRVVELFSLK